jgi:hypothetical protein
MYKSKHSTLWKGLVAFSFAITLMIAGLTPARALILGDDPGILLKDEELDQIRGGYSGFYFGVYFTGYFDTLGNVYGSLVTDGNIGSLPAAPLLPPPGGSIGEISTNGAVIQAYVGNFNGASGIFQISQSPGSYNVIQNNLMFQITVINVANASALESVRQFLPW